MRLSLAVVALLGFTGAKDLSADKADLKHRLLNLKDLANVVEGGNNQEILQFVTLRKMEI